MGSIREELEQLLQRNPSLLRRSAAISASSVTADDAKRAEKVFHTLKPFDPADSKADLALYLKNLERISLQAGWNEEQFVFLARQKFVGNALRALEIAQADTWEDFRSVLFRQFGITTSVAEERLRQLKKKRNQTVADYANEFRYLRSLCCPHDMSAAETRKYMDLTEQSAIRQFIAGLGQPLSDKVYSAEPKDLEACISKAVFEEANPSLKSSRLEEIQTVAAPRTALRRYSEKFDSLVGNGRNRAHTNGHPPLGNRYDPQVYLREREKFCERRPDTICHRCNGIGHYARNCATSSHHHPPPGPVPVPANHSNWNHPSTPSPKSNNYPNEHGAVQWQ